MTRLFLLGGVLGLASLTLASTAIAAPLLVEGKQTVYQRVLTRPGALLADAPGGNAARELAPFEPLYVFERGDGWLQVGHLASAEPGGWVEAGQVVDWRQNIVAAFTNPANRSRQLIFSDLGGLRGHMNAEAVAEKHAALLAAADAGTPPAEAGVISVEPAEHIDIRDNFYVMPILDFVQDFHPLSFQTNIMMQVASLPLGAPEPEAEDADGFDAGVVFVIDTTTSMLPYFDVMRRQVQDMVELIDDSELGKQVNFGVVAFRDDIAGRPDLEYRVREVLPLEKRDDQAPVVSALAGLQEAQASTIGFNEDSLSAVAFALEKIDWTGYDGRFVVLVTDAGPKLPGADGTSYQNRPEDLQAAAEAQQIALMPVHLQTGAGRGGNHGFAAAQYRRLGRFAGAELYFPIENGDPAAFAEQTRNLIEFIRDQAARAQGLETASQSTADPQLAALGAAIQLQYLGSTQGTAAPELFDGWLSGLAVEDGTRQAVNFRLLVTRNELATMADLVEQFIAASARIESDDDLESFHGEIREAILRMSQDPNRLVDPGAEVIGDAMEFLEDLPYQSVLLRTSQDRWLANPGERQVVLDGLGSKLRSYRRWLGSPEVWQPLFDGAPDSEWVTALPVEFLP